MSEIGGYFQKDYMFAEDYPTQLYLMLKGKFKFIDENLGFYRMHGSQMTQSHALRMIETDNQFIKEFFNELNQDYKKNSIYNEETLELMLRKKYFNSLFNIGRQ